jgi:hypothetical protein
MHIQERDVKKLNNGAHRRNLLRMSVRLGITLEEAILKFYGVKSLSDLDRNLVWSLTGRSLRIGKKVGKNNKKKKKRNGFFGNNTESFWKRPLYLHDPRES